MVRIRTHRQAVATLAAMVAVGALAGCGGDNSAESPQTSAGSPTGDATGSASKEFNDADVSFATQMITHHRQAVEMAKLAPTRAGSAKVKKIAAGIEAAQGPEIETMSGWLTAWGKPVPEEMAGMDMSGSMPGMMSTEDMDALAASSGADFDTKFLTMMIAHHQGALEMASTEMANGVNPAATALAEAIAKAQTAEIATMQAMLN